MGAVNPIRVVRSTTEAIVRETMETSYFWDQAFDTVHRVHLIWEAVEKISIYGDPDNFLQLLAGHSLSFVAGDNVFVKLAASTVMIATRIMECVKEEFVLLKEIQKLSDICFDPTVIPPKYKWAKPEDYTFLSPSCVHWLKTIFVAFIDQTIKIARALLEIMKQLFTLSMRMLSAAKAFSLDPSVVREGTAEIFVNLEKCHKALSENKELLLDFLKEYQPVIEKILEGFGSTYSYKTLVDNVEMAIGTEGEPAENEGFTLKKYGRLAFQHAVYHLFQSVNMHTYLPLDWIPPLEPEWMVEEEAHPRYPPEKWVQIFEPQKTIKEWRFKMETEYAGKSVLYNEL